MQTPATLNHWRELSTIQVKGWAAPAGRGPAARGEINFGPLPVGFAEAPSRLLEEGGRRAGKGGGGWGGDPVPRPGLPPAGRASAWLQASHDTGPA